MPMLDEHQHKHPTHNFDGIVENRVTSPPVYFTVLFYGLIVWGVAFCAFYLLSGWSSEAEFRETMSAYTGDARQDAPPAPAVKPDAPPPAPAQPPAVVAATAPATAAPPDAKALYAGKCAMCHGADGKGGFGPDLTVAGYEYGKTREAIFQSISQGRANHKMPAFEGQLRREEIYALADYLLSLK